MKSLLQWPQFVVKQSSWQAEQTVRRFASTGLCKPFFGKHKLVVFVRSLWLEIISRRPLAPRTALRNFILQMNIFCCFKLDSMRIIFLSDPENMGDFGEMAWGFAPLISAASEKVSMAGINNHFIIAQSSSRVVSCKRLLSYFLLVSSDLYIRTHT